MIVMNKYCAQRWPSSTPRYTIRKSKFKKLERLQSKAMTEVKK